MSTSLRVLILEDRPADLELMLHALRRAGFDPEWRHVVTESDYLAHLNEDLDVILADYALPQFDALRALHLLQERGLDIPFIMVTGSVSEETAVECLKQGAADYLLKDRLARLGPAVKRALREKEQRRGQQGTAETSQPEHDQTVEALRASVAMYRTLVEQLPAIIYTTSLSEADTTFYVSPQIERILGFSQAEWTKGPKVWLSHLHRQDRRRVLDALPRG